MKRVTVKRGEGSYVYLRLVEAYREYGPCDYTNEAREIADEARAIAANATRLARLHRPAGGAKSEENSPPF